MNNLTQPNTEYIGVKPNIGVKPIMTRKRKTPTPDEPTPDEPTPDEPTPDEPTPDEMAAIQRNFLKFAKQSLAYDPATNTSKLTKLGRNRISGKPYPKNKPNISGKGYIQYLVRGYIVGKWVDISKNAERSTNPLQDELSVRVRIDGKDMWVKPEDMRLYDIKDRKVIGNINMISLPPNSKSVQRSNGKWIKPESINKGGRRLKTQRKRK